MSYPDWISQGCVHKDVRVEKDGEVVTERGTLFRLEVGKAMIVTSFFVDASGEWGCREVTTSIVLSINPLPKPECGTWVLTKNSRYRLVWPPESKETRPIHGAT